MRWNFLLSLARTLLLLGLIVPMNGVTAAVPDELLIRLDNVKALFAERHGLVKQEGEVLHEIHTTTDRELEHQLSNQHQEILQKIKKIDESRLRILGGAVDLLSGYSPAIFRDCEMAIRETERLVEFLKMERHMIGSDPDAPDDLITERGIDKLLERAVKRLSFLYMEKKKLSQDDTRTKKQQEEPDKPEHKKGLIAWFDRQQTAIKVALIGAVASIIGALATVVVAAIRRRA